MGQKKKRKKKVILKKIRIIAIFLLIVLAIILISCGTNGSEKQTKATKTVSKYMSYINEENYDAMYEMIDSNSKNRVTKEEFITRNRDIYDELRATEVNTKNMTEEELENRKNESSIYNRYANNSRRINFCKYNKAF